MRRSLLLIFFAAFVYSNAFGARAENVCLGFKNFQFVNLKDSLISSGASHAQYQCSDFAQFDDLAGRVNGLFDFRNKGVSLITINNVRKSSDDFTFDHVEIVFDRNNLQDIKYIQPVFIHEFAHALLNEYLFHSLPNLTSALSIRNANQDLAPFVVTYVSLLDSDGRCSTSQCHTYSHEHSTQIEESVKASDDINTFIKSWDYKSFISIILPYHELFADLVSAVEFDDPKIIQKSLSYYFGKEKSNEFSCRNFTFVAAKDFSSVDPHCSLSELRALIWSKVTIAKPTEQKKILLNKILRIVSEQIISNVDRVSRNPELSKSFPDQEAKDSFRNAIQDL